MNVVVVVAAVDVVDVEVDVLDEVVEVPGGLVTCAVAAGIHGAGGTVVLGGAVELGGAVAAAGWAPRTTPTVR